MIAYIQTIIFLKCLAQFNTVWWDKTHSWVCKMGIDTKPNFATFDLLLLLALFLHRVVLKRFGVWQTDNRYEFKEGTFHLEKKDAKTKNLIQQTLLEENQSIGHSDRYYEDIIHGGIHESQNHLIREDSGTHLVYRHELDSNNVIKEVVIKKRNQLLRANEKVFKDTEGRQIILLCQDEVRLRLNPIDDSEEERNYTNEKIVFVEHTIEEPTCFAPVIIVRSCMQYFSLICNFSRKLLPSHRTALRKPVDVYTYMFLCGFTNFFVLLFGFSQFVVRI
jgi:hypothetical protein